MSDKRVRRNQHSKLSDKERLLEKIKINPENGCWEWTSSICSQTGYGKFLFNGKKDYGAHRASYILLVSEIPPGDWVLHHCDNRKCVNPDHLFLGNHTDNMRDAQAKGRKPISQCPSLWNYQKGCRCDDCVAFKKAYHNNWYKENYEAKKDKINETRRARKNSK